ncbi:MAG: tRNA (5-methylaminomethyl-2-thiouridylate)-methyltransferase [Candidatus Scalindua brodae]|uniref:tRNA-specific 2-thiouridylase MnmA n=1 Tax=Candidatus Scalindua brodae TaxID=237368 RepID=A0A0B0EFF5_9BACT|nr:MAG: tRNA (5-methylaminomethyl-2-thiouridylate)-methyltransferase [Candidatus Scalindua brodae]
MSGGVDSSVAAHFLIEQGYDVIGLFMRLGNTTAAPPSDRKTATCCSAEDARDARNVASFLGIPFYVINFEDEFNGIIEYFCDEYLKGRTPNPCIICNQELKFGKLLRFADYLKADFVATGHFARIDRLNERYVLKKGIDDNKDQSYVLFSLDQNQLSRAMFPLGNMTKDEVRKEASKVNLKTKDKPESQEICFVTGKSYSDLIVEKAGTKIGTGLLKDTDDNTLGKHGGIHNFTIGQRKGLGMAFGEPRYVVDIDPTKNTVTVGAAEELLKETFTVDKVNWISIEKLENELCASVKIRYKHDGTPAVIYPLKHNRVRVELKQPQRAITPGQAAVFYHDDIVIGGGWIER